MRGLPRTLLESGWELTATPPGAIADFRADALSQLTWQKADALGTVASILRARRLWSVDITRRFDAEDWWYRLRFRAPSADAGDGVTLGFDGLATIADVWLNSTHLLHSTSMFVAHEIPVQELLRGENELLLRFQSLDALLATRLPRPRWRAPMVENQNLRWFRTTLLGRLPGWSPPVAAVGPWRPIWIRTGTPLVVRSPSLATRVEGRAGILRVECQLAASHAHEASVELLVSRGAQTHAIALARAQDSDVFAGELTQDPVDLWWPHTHGEPALYQARLEVHFAGFARPSEVIDLGHVGFRTVSVEQTQGDFLLKINGVPIFCRGACWTPLDVVDLHSDPQSIGAAIAQVVAAGMNMLRVGGTMVYESDFFLDACDAHGVMLWQDFMFANMDYPEGNAGFDTAISTECQQLLARLQGRPCVTVLCGNSEAEQQAAMWGASRELWAQPLFHAFLPQLVSRELPTVPYWPSSAHGGVFPHQANVGTTSYYGVGAYLRPLEDARRAEIRFATECLAFANVPEESTLATMSAASGNKAHSPLWKSRVPRDLSAGWDFDDVRDFYLHELFGMDPIAVRYAQHDRYMDVSRALTAEIMADAFREWRRARSTCNGALIWFLRDLWPGAGWGIVDALGTPKAAYYCLRRLLQPQTVFFSDEGVSGLFVHVVNERPLGLEAVLEITLLRAGHVKVASKRATVEVPPRTALELPLLSMLDEFIDLTYAYRFGPPPAETVIATLIRTDETPLARDFHFLSGHALQADADVGLSTNVRRLDGGDAVVEVLADRVARYVRLQVDGFRPEDQYFHVAPGSPHRVHLHNLGSHSKISGEARALNSSVAHRFRSE
jgi:beta-mannosidase